jgi:hypothetical protein
VNETEKHRIPPLKTYRFKQAVEKLLRNLAVQNRHKRKHFSSQCGLAKSVLRRDAAIKQHPGPETGLSGCRYRST